MYVQYTAVASVQRFVPKRLEAINIGINWSTERHGRALLNMLPVVVIVGYAVAAVATLLLLVSLET